MEKNYIVFTLSANRKLAREVAKSIKAPLGRVSVTHFADGEILVKTLSIVKDKDVIVIQSTKKKAHEKLFELLLFLDSASRSGARSVQLFMPYFGYSRQERVTGFNEPVSCQVVAKMINTTNVDSLVTFDLHHPTIETFFTVPITNESTTPLFGEYYRNYLKEHNIKNEDIIIVSPDHGSNLRADHLKDELPGSSKIILNKYRPKANQAEHLSLNDDVVHNKVCIIIDDIIDTGGTITSATKLLYDNGAKSVLVGASHAVMSNNCAEKLRKAGVNDIVSTNSIERNLNKGVKILDILPLVLKEIK